jgi:lipopolysaccharide cholinephosphotransferase
VKTVIDNSTRIVQKNILNILKEIKRVCDENDIQYLLTAGTLLGAIRHGGFIPWDDDIDICMTLSNYKKFINVCKTKLGNDFFLQTFKTDPNYFMTFAKVRLNNSTFIPYGSEHHHIHQGMWVDVFPLISLPNNKFLRKIKNKLFAFSCCIQQYDFLKQNKNMFYSDDERINKNLKSTYKIAKFFSIFPLAIRICLHSMILRIIFSNPSKNKDLVEVVYDLNRIVPNQFAKETIMWDFEDDSFCISKFYDEYLNYNYGNYLQLPPENERHTHGAVIVDENNDYKNYIE